MKTALKVQANARKGKNHNALASSQEDAGQLIRQEKMTRRYGSQLREGSLMHAVLLVAQRRLPQAVLFDVGVARATMKVATTAATARNTA